MDKKQLRDQVKQRLGSIDLQSLAAKSKKACQNVINSSEYRNASVIMAFLSLPYEIETAPIILDAWQQDKTVVVPKVSWQQRHMIAIEINSLETGLTEEAFGLRSPTTGDPVPLEDIDLVITPGLAFDAAGGRLGRGGGYYDTFFANKELKAVKMGFCFSEQVLPEVPMSEHDHPVDVVISDNGVIEIN